MHALVQYSSFQCSSRLLSSRPTFLRVLDTGLHNLLQWWPPQSFLTVPSFVDTTMSESLSQPPNIRPLTPRPTFSPICLASLSENAAIVQHRQKLYHSLQQAQSSVLSLAADDANIYTGSQDGQICVSTFVNQVPSSCAKLTLTRSGIRRLSD